MATPIEQYVPADFQNVIDLPSAQGPDSAAAQQAQGALTAQQKALSDAQRNATNLRAQIKRLQQQLGSKGLSEAKRKAITAQVTAMKTQISKADAAVSSITGKLPGLQNAYYEASGQYGKLLEGENRDAFLALQGLFNQYGLGSLAGKIYDFVKQGYGADTIALLLQDTAEYKTRFAGNEARKKAGLAVLNPADYLSTEAAYRQILSSAGLPKGFYDNPADFTKWIADDVSPTEIKSRVDLAVAATGQANSAYKDALFQMYGINESDLTAYFLDRKRAEPILKKQAAAGAIGAAAIRRGFAANTLDLEGYATLGITADQAEQAYAQISSGFSTMLGLAGRYGEAWNQREAEQEVFTPGASRGGQEAASEKGKRLRSQERALFSGGRGSSVQGLNAGYSAT
jgi:hypothetical protein